MSFTYYGAATARKPISSECTAAAPWTPTCAAIGHADLVRIKGEDFQQILNDFTQVLEHFRKIAVDMLQENAQEIERAQIETLGEFLSQGLMNAQSLLVLDLQKCTRCDEC